MTNEEQWIKESIENYIFAYTGKRAKISDADAQHFTASVMSYLNLCTPSLPSDLDEAANTFGFKETLERLREGGITRKNEGMFRWQIEKAFKSGAEWMAGQGVSLSHLMAWYIQSVDAHEPVWTKEHLEELVKDYILIPKN